MKTILRLLTVALAITAAQSAFAKVPERLNCRIERDGNEAYLLVRASGGSYKVPYVRHMIEMMDRDNSLHISLKDAVVNHKVRSFVTDAQGNWKDFWFRNRPSYTGPMATCRDKTINGAECFDRMLKKDPRFQVAEGVNAPYWMFASIDDLEPLYAVASKMGCVNNFRLGASTQTPQRQEAQAAPAAAAPAPRPAAPAPRPASPSEVLGSERTESPSASLSTTSPTGRQEVIATIVAPASSGAAAR